MKQTQVLLLENVYNLGIVGDVVPVKPGYARNYLIPHGLATVPTPGAIERLKDRRAQAETEMAEQRRRYELLLEKLDGYELTLERSANEQGVLYGSVSQHDVGEALREQGFDIEDRYIRLGDVLKRLDSYEIPIVIDKDLKAEIKLWIVSDKPAEELEAEPAAEPEPSTAEATAASDREGESAGEPDQTAPASAS